MFIRAIRFRPAAFWLLAAFLLVAPSALDAHPLNNGYSQVSIEGRTVRYELTVPEPGLLAFDTNKNSSLEADELDSRRPDIDAYLRSRLELESSSGPLTFELQSMEKTDKNGIPAIAFQLRFTAAKAVDSLTIRYNVLFDDADPLHLNFAVITRGDDLDQTVFDAANRTYLYRPMAPAGLLGSVWAYFTLGIEHIATGYDHLVFLLSLVLVASGLKDIVKIVTAFTVAHSITLFLAATGIITVDSRFVEAAIALTIAYVAAENMLAARSIRLRWLVTFVFGLIHGMGFAGAISEIGLPEAYFISSLLSFNAGVEAGQLAIVMVALPFLLKLQRSSRYRLAVVSVSAAVILLAACWFLERVGLL